MYIACAQSEATRVWGIHPGQELGGGGGLATSNSRPEQAALRHSSHPGSMRQMEQLASSHDSLPRRQRAYERSLALRVVCLHPVGVSGAREIPYIHEFSGLDFKAPTPVSR